MVTGPYNIVGRRAEDCTWEEVATAVNGDDAIEMIDGLATSGKYVRLELRGEDSGDTAFYAWPAEGEEGNDADDIVMVPYGTDEEPLYPAITIFNFLVQTGFRIRLETTDDLGLRWTLLKGYPYPTLDAAERGTQIEPSQPGWIVQGRAGHFGEAMLRLAEAVAERFPDEWFVTHHWAHMTERDKELLLRAP